MIQRACYLLASAYHFLFSSFSVSPSSVPLSSFLLGILKVLSYKITCSSSALNAVISCLCQIVHAICLYGFGTSFFLKLLLVSLGSIYFITIPGTSNIISKWFQKLIYESFLDRLNTFGSLFIHFYISRTYTGPSVWNVLSKHLILRFSCIRVKGVNIRPLEP